MIDFLLKSTISLTVFLSFYHLVLEREKMHQFNRFYLLFSIVISFVIPFLTFEIIKIVPVENFEPMIESTFPIPLTENQIEEKINYTPYILWSLYVLVCFILLFRFWKNIWKLISKSKSNPIVKYKNANLILVEEETLPHSFLNSIFINFEDYNNRNIEDELYTHELVHVTQKHTLDILFIEFLKVIFWFNPILNFYKKAIQLNHEFLADEEIVKTYNNVPFYQNLLLQKGNGNQTIYLASNLNYLVTKKRLIMMTKSTSQKIALLKKVAIVPILASLIYFFCIEVVAKEKIISVKSEATNYKSTEKDKIRDNYFSGVYVKIIDDRINRRDITLYENLSLEDKRKYLNYIPEKRVENKIPAEIFEKLKTENNYVLIDGKVSNKEEIKKYNRNDFSYYTKNSVYINDKKNATKYHYALYTKPFFDKNIKNSHLHFTLDTVKIVFAKYQNLIKDDVLKKSKIDTIVWQRKGNEEYNLYINDTVKKKKSSTKTSKQESIELKKVVDKANLEDYKKNEVKKLTDFNPGNLKNGYIYMTNKGTFFFIKKDDNTVEYYNRFGFRVNENGEKLNGEKLNGEKSDENLKYRTATEEEIEKVKYDKTIKSLDDIDKGNKKEGYLYMNNATYFFIKNDKGEIEYFNRWGNHVNNKGEKKVETK